MQSNNQFEWQKAETLKNFYVETQKQINLNDALTSNPQKKESEVAQAMKELYQSLDALGHVLYSLVDNLEPVLSRDVEAVETSSPNQAFSTPLANDIYNRAMTAKEHAQLIAHTLKRLEV